MTQAELAKRLKVSKGLVSQWASGLKECPADRIEAIAQVLALDRSFLRGTGMTATLDAQWTFRLAPPDGGRDYGNSNVFATPPDLATLVRETGQNSKDQRLPDRTPVHVRYELIDLQRGTQAHTSFMEALRFDELRPHLAAAAATESRLGRKFKAALERLESQQRLLLLRIDDFGTTGLIGDETPTGGHNPFAALVRNNLDSSKANNATAGGSFGLGKAVLWRCSGTSIVAFSSRVAADPGKLRFIGKTELTWHELDRTFAGPGWLAGPDAEDQSAPSIWTPADALRPLFLDRADVPVGVSSSALSGTSMLIVDFADPRGEGEADPEHIMAAIEAKIAENFWPAIASGEFSSSVSHRVGYEKRLERVVDPRASSSRPFVEALGALRAGLVTGKDTAEPGDTVCVPVKLVIPATQPNAVAMAANQEQTESEASLLVRLADEESLGNPLTNTVALVRGLGMVVEYWQRQNLVVGGRPFHAIVMAGEMHARNASQTAAEVFLRLSEPPAHNCWTLCEDIRDNYKRGAGARLAEFFDQVTGELRTIIRPAEEGVEDDPEELRRLLSARVRAPVARLARLTGVRETFTEGRWSVEGEIRVLDRRRALTATIGLSVVPESGTSIRIGWANLEILKANRGSAIVDGTTIQIAQGTTSVRFRAQSEPSPERLRLDRCLARVTFDVEEREEANP